MPQSSENKSCVRADWILLVKRAETVINSDQNFNQLKVDESTEPSVVESVFKLGDAHATVKYCNNNARGCQTRPDAIESCNCHLLSYSHPRINGDLV
jgi:hypothetical protein